MVQRHGHYDGMNKNDWKHLSCWYGEDGECKMERQNKKCSCARKSGRRKSNAGTDKEEEKKLPGSLAKKELPAEGCSRRYGKWEGSSRQKKISDDRNIMINGLYEDTKWKAEKRVESRMLSFQ